MMVTEHRTDILERSDIRARVVFFLNQPVVVVLSDNIEGLWHETTLVYL